MGMKLDDALAMLDDFHEWEKQFASDGSGGDDATKTVMVAARKYQKVKELFKKYHVAKMKEMDLTSGFENELFEVIVDEEK